MLAYARTRYVPTENASNDFGRTERQRIVLQTVFQKLKTRSWEQLLGLYGAAAQYVSTDMDNNEILSLALTAYSMGIDSLNEYRVPADGSYTDEWIRNMSVLVPSDWDQLRSDLQDFLFR